MAGDEALTEETLAALTREYWREPSPGRARELAALHEAAGRKRLEACRGQAPVVPEAGAHFSDVTGLPEIAASDLDAGSLASALGHCGGLLVRGLYNHALLERLRAHARVQEAIDREDHSPLGCSPETLVLLLDVYRESGLLDVVATYLDDRPLLFAERVKLRQHRAQTHKYAAIPWHQDVSFFGRKSRAVNCWAAVTPCGRDNPGISLIPHRVDDYVGWNPETQGLAPLDYGRSLSAGELEALTDRYPAVQCCLEPGDALLFDEMTVHKTNSRPWRLEQQIVTISWFFRAGAFPDWGTPLAVHPA